MAGKLTVYVVDDSRTQAEIARALLEKAGHEAIISTASQEALVKIPCVKPDCVLFDLMMPGLDGYEVTRRLRGEPITKDVPIVIVTAAAEESQAAKALDAGADAYMKKPFSPRELLAKTASLILERRPRSRAASA